MATTTTRIKDIPTTATTAASDDYFMVDGATNGTRKYAHNDDPVAHLNIVRRTLTGNLVLTAADSSQQKILPDADRDITLPAEGSGQWLFVLCHGGATHTVTVQRAGGTAVASLVAGSVVIVAWDGTDISIC